DWTLVMASYNYGPGNVNKALQRAGANASTYWDIYPFLPKATRDYVPAFVALAYLYYYHSDYGVVPFASPLPLATDTVMVSRRIDLNRVSEKLNLPSELVKLLNPQYKQDVIPATVKSYPLVLPQQEVCRFIECEQARLAQADTLPADTVSDGRLTASAASSQQGGSNGDGYSGPDPLTYKVKKGDTLGAIAHKYRTVSQLMKWNQLKNSNLKIGQTLKIIR
ncbi:MAG: LysM peptidoglycan-binding domain-containing protein, partial [Alistipes sp.]